MFDKQRIGNLVVCADDYAQSSSISAAIYELAQQNRIHAMSCLVNGVYWKNDGVALKQLSSKPQIGLHFNLTQGRPLSDAWKMQQGEWFPALPQLFYRLMTRQIAARTIQLELAAQWEHFVKVMGQMPDFLDGHQHVHQFGVIRLTCVNFLKEISFSGYCRVSANDSLGVCSIAVLPKATMLYACGGRALRRTLNQQKIKTNTSFAGFYPFKEAKRYRDFFRGFLRQSQAGGLIMCHPGLKTQDASDPLCFSRGFEYDYLMSPQYWTDMKEFGFA